MHSKFSKGSVQRAVTFIIAVLLCASAEAGQWRWALGAQIDPASHGIVDVGYRSDGLSIELFTDTLDLRYRHRVERGQWEIGLRGALFGAELLFSPWENGEPAPQQALRASYAGLDLSRSWWFQDGKYIGLLSELRLYQFGEWRDSVRTVPDARGRLRVAAKFGVWNSVIRSEVLGGFVQDGDTTGFWVEGKLNLPRTTGLGLMNQTYLGWSDELTRLSRFRLGGLNPYVVPFAGLGWAEAWVERYAVQRLGLGYLSQNKVFDVAAGIDLGIWDDEGLRMSPLVLIGVERGADKFAASGGVVAFERKSLEFGGWSLFFWYERTWG